MRQVSIKRNFLYNASFQFLLMVVPLITTPYISRVLGAENIGIQSYTNSIVSYFVLFATCGLNMYGQREIAYHSESIHEKSRIFWEVSLNKLVFTILALLMYVCFVYQVTDYKEIFVWQGINLIACAFDISWYFQGIQDFKRIVMRNAAVKLIGVACIFSFIHTSDDLALYVILLGSTTLVGNVILWGYMRKRLVRVPLQELNVFRDKRIKLELFAPFIAIQIYTVLDKTMIGIFTGDPAQNGYYEQAQKVVQMSLAIITSLGTVLLPNISARFAQRDLQGIRDTVMKAYQFILMCACPMTCGLIALAPVFVPWFFGPGFEEVIILMQLFSLLFIIISLSNIAGIAVLTPINRQNYGTLATIAGAFTNFSFNLILIAKYGAMGAAIASVLAEFVVTAVHLYFIRIYVDVKKIISWLLKYLSPAIMIGVFVYILGYKLLSMSVASPLITVVQIVFGIVCYIIVLVYIYKERRLMSLGVK